MSKRRFEVDFFFDYSGEVIDTGIIEIDQRFAIYFLTQDRKVLAHPFDVESQHRVGAGRVVGGGRVAAHIARLT